MLDLEKPTVKDGPEINIILRDGIIIKKARTTMIARNSNYQMNTTVWFSSQWCHYRFAASKLSF